MDLGSNLHVEGWRIDLPARTAQRGERTEQLSPRAIRLLKALAEANGAVVSREALLDRIWPSVTVSDESLTQVVSELRRKLGNRELVATIARGGYRLTVPCEHDCENQAAKSTITDAAFSIDAYAMCIEAREQFEIASEGVHRTFVDLAAQAVAKAPAFAEARSLLATALFKRHIYLSEGAMLLEECLTEAEAAIRIDPSMSYAHLIEGAARITIGKLDQGLRSVETALSLGRDDAALHLDAAILLLSMGNHRTAAALATRSAQLAPNHYGADMLLARIMMDSDPHRARLHAERALRKVQDTLSNDPHSMRALYALGPLLAQLGDTRAARSALEGVSHHDSALEYYRALASEEVVEFSSALAV